MILFYLPSFLINFRLSSANTLLPSKILKKWFFFFCEQLRPKNFNSGFFITIFCYLAFNKEKRNSKNYVLFLGKNDTESNQQPCLSLIQFQISDGKLIVSAYQRSSDANLGLPADIYHLYLISRQIDVPLKSITIMFGKVHLWE